MISVIIADDHPVILDGVRARLNAVAGIAVTHCVGDIAALDSALKQGPADVVVLDVQMPEGGGPAAVKLIQAYGAAVCLFTLRTPDALVASMVRAGATGFVSKSDPVAALVDAISTLTAGRPHLPAELQELADAIDVPPHLSLSPRERQVFDLMIIGLTTKEAAFELGTSTSTMYKHMHRIRTKLGVMSAADLVRYADAWGLSK